MGYLSEIERGLKEASSEVLATIAHALDATVPDVLTATAARMRGTADGSTLPAHPAAHPAVLPTVQLEPEAPASWSA